MRRSEFSPYLLASLVLHLLVFAGAMVSWRLSRDLKVGAVVPVNLVSNAPATDLAPAVQAPEEQTAQTEDPVPDAPPEPASPDPEPTPKPPEPKPTPTPKAAPAAKTPPTKAPTPKAAPTKAAAKPTPKPTEKGLDLDALAASLKTSRPTGGRTSSATKGAARPQTAAEARPALGSAQAAAAISGLSEELQRRWNPNCSVEGGRDVQLRVTFTLGAGGQVVGEPKPQIRSAPGAVAQAAAERAVRAVYAAAPFRNLPREFYGQSVNVNFVAREACS